MQKLRQKTYSLLRLSERIFKTDMIHLSKSGFWNTFKFAVGLAVSVVTMIAFGNLLPKEVYGTYSYLLSLGGSLGFLTLGGISTALTRAVARGKESLLPYAMRLQFKFNSLAIIGILSISIYYGIKGNLDFAFSLAILAFAIPLASVYHAFESVLIGKKRFDTLAIITSIISIVSALGTVATLIMTDNVLWIVFSYAMVSIIPNLVAYRFVEKGLEKSTPTEDDKYDLKRSALHLTGAGVLSTISQYLDKIVLFQVAGPGALAIYGFATAGPERLKGLIKNWTSIALPNLSERSVQDINSVLYRRIALVVTMGVGLTLVYVLLSPLLFKWFLPKYLDSILYSQAYAVGLIFVPISNYIGYMFYGQNMLRAVYINTVGSQLLRIALFLVFGWKWQIWGLVVASVLSYFASALYSFLVWKYESSRILRQNA